MKTPNKGDIVTPLFQPGDIATPKSDSYYLKPTNQYLVIGVDIKNNSIILVNDAGVLHSFEAEHFHNITIVPLFARICNFVNNLFQI